MIELLEKVVALLGIARRIEQQNVELLKGQVKIMAGVSDIQTAQAAEKADLAILVGLVPQLLAAFASGQMTPAQAQGILDEINSEDSTIKTSTGTIQAALAALNPPATT